MFDFIVLTDLLARLAVHFVSHVRDVVEGLRHELFQLRVEQVQVVVELLLRREELGAGDEPVPARDDTIASVDRSDGHVDGVTVASRRVDAIDASLKFGKVQKQTLSQHGMNAVVRCSASTKQRYTALTRGDSDDADSKS